MLLHLPTAPGERLAMFIQRRPRPRDLLAFHFRVASAPAGRYEQPPAEPLARLWSTTAGPIQGAAEPGRGRPAALRGRPRHSCPAAVAMPVRATSSRGDEKPHSLGVCFVGEPLACCLPGHSKGERDLIP